MAQANLSMEHKLTHRHRGQTCGCQGGGGASGTDCKLGVTRCKLLRLEWISNEILLYNTGNYILSLVMEHDNVRKRMYTCMCDWVTLLYSRIFFFFVFLLFLGPLPRHMELSRLGV